jgi:hypothetical protein
MKNHHAAALAFVGWSIIVPPFQGLPSPFKPHANLYAPLRDWQLLPGSWTSAEDCNQQAKRNDELYLAAKQKLDRVELERLAKAMGFGWSEHEIFGAWMEQAYLHALCVPDDDPRLDRFVPIGLR